MTIHLEPYYRKELEGGPTLLVKERKEHPVVSVNFWIATGSVNEEPALNGISHFYEHIFFKGTDRYPRGEMDRQVKAMGGYNNAATSYEFTHYFIVSPKWHLRKSMDLLVDATLNPSLREEDVEKERMIIREEIRRRDDNPNARLFTLLQEEMFMGTPYSLPILGREESLENIRVEELESYFKGHYGLSNLTIIIVGDVGAGEAEEILHEILTREERLENEDAGSVTFEPKTLKRTRDRFERKDINQVYAAVGFQTPGMRKRELLPAFEIAAMVLGGSKSSRLYRRLLEREKLVSSISSWHMELRNSGIFGIDTIFRPGREREVNQFLFEEISEVVGKGIEEEELARAKTMLRSGFLYENETNAALSGTLGYYEISFGDAGIVMEYLEALENITCEDVQRVMIEYVADQPFVRVVVGPDAAGE